MEMSKFNKQRSPCSLDDALHNVDRNLVYDPITKKLCLKTTPSNNISNNNIFTKQLSEPLEYDAAESSKTLKPCSITYGDLKNNNSCANSSLNKINVHNFEKKTNESRGSTKCTNNLDEFLNDCNIPLDSDVHIHSVKRPENLPPKSKNEERKHRAQFLEILQHAKSKDLKEKKLQKEVSIKQIQQENEVQKLIKTWMDDILPCWASSHISKRVQDLWWHGIPPSIRPVVWNMVIGNDLHITEQLFHICVKRSKEKIWTKQFTSVNRRLSNPMSSCPEFVKTHRRTFSHTIDFTECPQSFNLYKIKDIDDEEEEEQSENIAFLIKLDVLRTFPQLGLFQETGPYHESLCDILSAYVVYRPDIGYCQGMSFLAAMLLLNSQCPSSAFTSLANLLNNDLLLAFYSLNQEKMQTIYSYYDRQFHSLLPNLATHFAHIGLTTDLFFMYQVYTIFARSLSLDCASRVWDLFLRDGNEFIFRASLGILSMYQKELIKLEFIDSAKFLSNLPEDMDTEKYFETIASIKLIPPKFSTLLSDQNKIISANTNTIDNHNNNNSNNANNKSRYSYFVNKFLRF